MKTIEADRLPDGTGDTKIAFILFLVAGLCYSLLAWRVPGAGQDPDAWRLALTGLRWWHDGEYAPSRLPGFPVVELVAALLAPWKTLGFKVATAWVGAGCIVLTYLLTARYSIRAALIAALTLASCPAMILASTMMMDYVWSLAFLLLGLLAARREHAISAGILIGLAAGCRISALAVLPAAGLMLWTGRTWRQEASISRDIVLGNAGGPRLAGDRCRQARQIGLLVVAALGLAALCYGWVFAESPTPMGRLRQSLLLATFESLRSVPRGLFGNLGTAAVALAAIAAIVRTVLPRFQCMPIRLSTDGPFILMPASVCGAYLFMPHEPLYLLPALPPLFVLLARRIRVPIALLLISIFLLAGYRDVSSVGVIRGPVAQDARNRQRSVRLTAWLLRNPPAPPALVIAGYRAPMIEYTMKTDGPPLPAGTRVGYLLRSEMVRQDRRPSESLHVLGDALGECRRRGFDPLASGARVWWPAESTLDPLVASAPADPP